MDLGDYWQENKRFVSSVALGAVLFLVAFALVRSFYEGDIRSRRREISSRRADLTVAMFDASDLADAQLENDALRSAVDVLSEATRFVPRAGFALESGRGAANAQYLRTLARVREALLQRANRANVVLDATLGMPSLSPTREAEIERYLEVLDVVETVIDLAIDARVQRIDKIQPRLDPGLNSREGLGDIERTRVAFTFTGTSLALERVLTWTQRPQSGRVLHVEDVEMVPARSREQEVRLDLVIVIARLSEPVEEEV